MLYIIYHITYTFHHFLSDFFTPRTPNIILSQALKVIFHHLYERFVGRRGVADSRSDHRSKLAYATELNQGRSTSRCI